MKLIVSKAVIEGAAKMLSKVINKKNPLPILGDILCDVKDNQMRMTASDSEVIMSMSIKLDTQEGDGSFCVSADLLRNALSQLPEQPVTIIVTTDGDMKFTLQHQSGSAFFPLDDADTYPLPMDEKYNDAIDAMKGQWLIDALKRCLWAAADDELRPIMCGVCFSLSDGNLDIVASDGHALAKSRYSVIAQVNQACEASFIIPKKVAKILSDVTTTDAKIEWNDCWAHVNVGLCDVTFRLIEGKYPNYNSVIPEDQPLCAIVPRAFIMNSIRKVIPFALDNCGSKLLRMSFEKDKLTLEGQNLDFQMGAHDTMTIDYPYKPIEIGVNGSTLITIMSKLIGRDVCVNMSDETRAITIEPSEQYDDSEVTMLIMPMLLSNE